MFLQRNSSYRLTGGERVDGHKFRDWGKKSISYNLWEMWFGGKLLMFRITLELKSKYI